MAMVTCYPTYDMMGAQSVSSQHHHQQQQQQQHQMQSPMQQNGRTSAAALQKDYSIPLFVDCSVEYELPNQAKPPVGTRVEPLLMIHPCYFRKMESQRRSPFVNNMPNTSRTSQTVSSTGYAQATPSVAIAPVSSTSSSTSHRSSQHHSLQQQQKLQHSQMEAYVPRQTPQYCGGQQPQQQQQTPYSQQLQQQQQSNHYATLQSHMLQQRQHQMQHPHQTNHMHLNGTPNWERFMNPPTTSIVPSTDKSGKKSSSTKRGASAIAVASCASYGHVVEGGLPSHGRWESEKTSMAAIPRDYNAAIPEIMSGATHQQHNSNSNNNNHSMYRSGVVGKRDAMLSGSCHTASNSSSQQNNQNYINLAAGGLWETDKSLMAAIPRDFQAAIPTPPAANTHRSTTGQSLRGGYHHEDKSSKYRQYLRSQRAHPYMMTTGGGASSSSSSHSSTAYTHMTPASNFSTMQMHQQVSCYNV